ncbi:sensor histidine kinase [Ruminococcus sp.]|uniref:sensor histidine kinase n=1 Tax=Ruminococcus sp. TaxID=41978 RepID=UPI003AF59748
MELEYERQKEKSTAEYYDLLNEQNENSKIVMHDIKRHLNAIKSISGDDAVTEYIDNFIEDFSVNKSVDYCNNPMVNSIVNRYKSVCDRLGVKMNIDIRNADFGFMNQPDITALLDNLLENAVEAAENTENGFIDFSVFVRKNKYLSIQLTNSVKNIIAVKNDRIASSKKSGSIHGTGLKSIQKVVKKYDGEINMRFNEDDMTFSSNVVFEIPRLNYEY